MLGGTSMASFIIILIVAILSVMYVERLIKYKFRDEKKSVWKLIHIIAFTIVYIPLLGVISLLWIDADLIKRGMLVLSIFLYLSYKKYKKYNN